MGISLVKAAGDQRWAGLTSSARLVLMLMCTIALDRKSAEDDERVPGMFYGGRDLLVLQTSGLSPGDTGYPSAKRKVERAIGELRRAGAVRLVNNPRAGRRACYTLHPDDLFTGGTP
jgi:hypothetical protein